MLGCVCEEGRREKVRVQLISNEDINRLIKDPALALL